MSVSPLRRRLDLRTLAPGGGGPEFLLANLVDDTRGDHFIANGECTLPEPDAPLGQTGLTVCEFLERFRRGERGLAEAARLYGQRLYEGLLCGAPDLREHWQAAVRAAGERGLRLEIRLPTGRAAVWRGQPVASLPFELMCDDDGFLFRRAGWATVRRLRDVPPTSLRLMREPVAKPVVMVGWANVLVDDSRVLPEADFVAHEDAVNRLASSGRAEAVAPLRYATRAQLATALLDHRPHVLVWIGHGASTGSALVLHDDTQPGYPLDLGTLVDAGDFARDLRAGQVDLALLWSCHGAGTERALSTGVAEALLDPAQGGLAAVVASFSALEPAAVARFSAAVLDGLARDPAADLEASLARARDALDVQSLTWARPVLFLRTPPADPGLRLRSAPPDWQPMPDRSLRLLRLPPLPARSASFIDRLQRVHQVAQDLDHHAVVVLEGLPGLGKTELALAIAHLRRQAGEDVAFIDLTGQREIGNLQAQLGQLVSDTVLDGIAALFALVAGLRWTLVIDNAEDLLGTVDDRSRMEQLLRGLVQASPGFRCLVTSRRALAPAGADWLYSRKPVPLGPQESRALFVALAGRRLAAKDAEGSDLPALLAELGGLPRAIALMAGQLGDDVDVPALRDRLRRLGSQAIVAQDLFGEDLPASLDARLHRERLVSALNLSLQSAEAQDAWAGPLFEALGLFPAGIAQHMLPVGEFEGLSDALAVLLEHHLVQLVGEDRRIMVSAPVQGFAAWRLHQQLSAPAAAGTPLGFGLLGALVEALSAWMDTVAGALGTEYSARALSAMLVEEPNALQALAWLTTKASLPDAQRSVERLYETLAAGFQFASRAVASLATMEMIADAVQCRWPQQRVTATVWRCLGDLRVRTDDLSGALQAFELALPIYRQINDQLGEANSLHSLGNLRVRTEDLAGALQAYELALPLYRKINDGLGEANALHSLGELWVRTGNVTGAFSAYNQALQVYRRIGARAGEANVLRSLGDLRFRVDDLAGAFQAYEQALPIHQQVQDRLGEANALKSLGKMRARLYDLPGALQDCEQALQIYRQINARPGEANALRSLGELRVLIADLAGALRAYEQALAIYRQINDRLGEANALRSLGDLLVRTADLAGARKAYEEALQLSRLVNARLSEANTLQSLGNLRVLTDDLTGALEAFKLALLICRQLNERMGEANALKSMADLLMRSGDVASALEGFDQALLIYQQINARAGEASVMKSVGDLRLRSADLVGALQVYGQALKIYREINNRLGEANTLQSQGDLMVRTSDLAGALSSYEQALPIYRHINDRLGEANTLKSLGDLRLRTQDLSGALQQFEKALPIYRQINARQGEANALKSLGDLRMCNDDLAGALQAYDKALPIYRLINDRLGEANVLQALGAWQLARGSFNAAFSQMLDALHIQSEMQDALGVAGSLSCLARVAAHSGAVVQAAALAGMALGTFVQNGDDFRQGIVYLDLGQALLQSKRVQGVACLCLARTLAKKLGDPVADRIDAFLPYLRPEATDPGAFAAELRCIDEAAEQIVAALLAEVAAAVQAGEIDPYALPGQDHG